MWAATAAGDMALEEYRRKRDFTRTPEPAPSPIATRKKQLSYLIQKHDATRLHYDFRLELDGVLLSWAVTKGPSLDPADKRLAVRTEDHPLSYGGFEGTIPKGQYGGGTVMLWDRGTWEPVGDPHAGLAKGHLEFVLHGEKLKGRWDLVRMRVERGKENWLLIKGNDAEARHNGNAGQFLEGLSQSVKSGRTMEAIAKSDGSDAKKDPAVSKNLSALELRYPGVQLATLVNTPPEGGQWVHEIKFDGYRLLGFVAGGECILRTRNGLDWTAKFPAIAAAMEKLKADDAVIDMEAVVLDEEGRSGFQQLQEALGGGGDSEAIVGYAFDLLDLDGKDLSRRPLIERKKALEALLRKSKTGGALRFSEHFEGNAEEMLEHSCKLGLEGIKCAKRQEFIIIGYSDARSGSRALGALYLGYYGKGGELQYAGKVGTGFTMASARELAEKLKPLQAAKAIFGREEMPETPAGEWRSIHWAKPKLLCEVSFTEWTKDGRIRHPSFQGLREDKKATDVRQEMPAHVVDPLVLEGITITHPDRVISEAGHVTKGELAEYYAAVTPHMLEHIARHPLSLLRCPSGIDSQCFYQRNPGKGLGPEVHPFKFRHKGKSYEYLYIDSAKGLLSLIQMGAVEIHPWGASVENIDCPDRMIFDLDPAPDVPFEAVILGAQDLRKRLQRLGLESLPKVSGGKGLHVTVPLAGQDTWAEVKAFADRVAHELVEAAPEAYVATMTKAKRTGKIFIDFFRNDYTATAIADYSVRARSGTPVAVPLEWKELHNVKSADQFRMKDVLDRVRKKKLPAWPERQRLPQRRGR